jgi:sRNA-binding protein
MAIGPVGGAIYANQQTPFVSSLKADQVARIDLQNIIAGELLKEEDKKVQEIRETEENHEIDPDREHQKEEKEQEEKARKKASEEKESSEDSPPSSLHHLDIKV